MHVHAGRKHKAYRSEPNAVSQVTGVNDMNMFQAAEQDMLNEIDEVAERICSVARRVVAEDEGDDNDV